jgi:hypothetical protein
MTNRTAIDGEELRRLWRQGLDSGAGRDLSIDEIKEEARRRVNKDQSTVAQRGTRKRDA